MNTLLEHVTALARSGTKISVSLETRTLTAGGTAIVRNGQTALSTGPAPTREEALAEIERLYGLYRHSVPSRSARADSRYFRALGEDELTDTDLLYGCDRTEARVRLETYVLQATMSGALDWDEQAMGGTWFWKSERQPGLVLLRKWTERMAGTDVLVPDSTKGVQTVRHF